MAGIASYYAKVGISTDIAQLKKVDRYLQLLENKMRKFQQRAMKNNGVFNINFKFNTNRLQFDVQKAFIDVGRRVVFPVDRFTVNKTALAATVNSAIRSAVASANRNIVLNPRVNQPRISQIAGQGGLTGRHIVGAGAAAGAFSRYGMFGRYGGPAIAGGLAMYGGSALNRANQEVISAQLTTQAVVEAQGLQGQGPAAFEWLRSQGNRIGFSYLDQAQDYNNFLSNSLGAGRSLDQAQSTYLGFAEYARAMGTTPARQKLVMNALSQMEAKGTVSMEELRRQMAESMPGTMSVFAEALQRQTGGNLQGQDAMAALMAAVPKGQVKSDILPIVAEILRERAKPKLDVAMKTSQAEQARAINLLTDFTNIASKSGLEEGFARIFRTFVDGLSKSEGLVRSLASGFNEVTKTAREFLLIPQSISRMFEGKDSVVADWLFGKGETGVKILAFAYELRDLMSNISDLAAKAAKGWQMIFDVIKNNKDIFDRMLSGISTVNVGLSAVKSLTEGDTEVAKEQGKSFFQGYLDMVTFLPRQIPDMVTGGGVSGFLGIGSQNTPDSLRRAGETLTRQNMNQAFNVTLNIDGIFQSQQEADIAGEALAQQFVESVKKFNQQEYENTLTLYPVTQ